MEDKTYGEHLAQAKQALCKFLDAAARVFGVEWWWDGDHDNAEVNLGRLAWRIYPSGRVVSLNAGVDDPEGVVVLLDAMRSAYWARIAELDTARSNFEWAAGVLTGEVEDTAEEGEGEG